MRRYRYTIIVVVVLVIMLGAYFFITKYNKNKNSNSGGGITTERIIDLNSLEMEEVTVETDGDRIVFKKQDNEWVLVYPEGIKYDASRLSSVAINFSSVLVEKVIEEDASDLSKYGLDKPVSVVTAKMKDGTTATLEIGNLTPTKGAYYVKRKGENTVYTTDTYTIGRIMVKINDIRDKTLFAVGQDDILKISMERKGQLVFTAQRPDTNADWTLTYPIDGNANYSALYPMLSAITESTVTEFVEQNPSDLDKYGLASPAYVLEFETSEEKYRLLLGKEDIQNSAIYAMTQDSNEVYKISSTSFTFLDKPLKEIVEVFAYITNIWDVERIVVEMDGYTLDCKLETDPDKDTDKDKFYVNGKDASMKNENGDQPFRKYYQALIGVTLSDVEPNANPQGEAEITFTYYRKTDPKVMKVEFIPKDEHYYYVVRNGKYSGILVAKKKFDEEDGVRYWYNKLMEALNESENRENSGQ